MVDAEPDRVVGVNGETSAANLSLGELTNVLEAVAQYAKHNTLTHKRVDGNRVLNGTKSGNLERLHVENIDTLEITEEFESLETSRLVLTAHVSASLILTFLFHIFTVSPPRRIPPA